jgi:phage-related protein
MYENETFMLGTANTSGNLNVDSEVENVYSRLDDNAREDKTTYESLRP